MGPCAIGNLVGLDVGWRTTSCKRSDPFRNQDAVLVGPNVVERVQAASCPRRTPDTHLAVRPSYGWETVSPRWVADRPRDGERPAGV